MEIQVVGATNNYSLEQMRRHAQNSARICYSEKDWSELCNEPKKPELLDGQIIPGGHHSVFDHTWISYYISGIPKALVMLMNNERYCNTSEKSARYTQMKDVSSEQKELYNKWMQKLAPLIDRVYPPMSDSSARDKAIQKLAQENARYMTSVFTPTKFEHTLGLRQLNFLFYEFQRFIAKYDSGQDAFKSRLAKSMQEFVSNSDVKQYIIPGLENKTCRGLSFFADRDVETHFGDTYSTHYLLSFAGLAQAHRHRTIGYSVHPAPELGAPLGVYIPAIIRGDDSLADEWLRDIAQVASNDFPQAQLVGVNEMGAVGDLRSKLILRLCGHAQHEIMENTLATAKKYASSHFGQNTMPEIQRWLKPKCMQGIRCAGKCVWGGARALERRV